MDPITIHKLNQYGISFIKKQSGVKQLEGTTALAGYIACWGYFAAPQDIDDFVADINKVLNGQFQLVEDPDYSIHTYTVDLTPQGLKMYAFDSNNRVVGTDIFPVADIKVLLLAWKDFLLNG